MFDYQQFYPTPKDLAERMVNLIKNPEGMVLEPSAGNGALIDAYRKHFHTYSRSVHCIEINPERQATLKGKDYEVVFDNFLDFNPLTPYSVIIMNPPFHNGARHLMKAISICNAGGQIVCLLNAETIKNPYTKERRALLSLLKKQAITRLNLQIYPLTKRNDLRMLRLPLSMFAKLKRLLPALPLINLRVGH